MSSAEGVPPAPEQPDPWDAIAKHFARFAHYCWDSEGTFYTDGEQAFPGTTYKFPYWQLRRFELDRISHNPRLRAVHDKISGSNLKWAAATTHFPLFVEWWTASEALPASVDSQDPVAVLSWLEQLAGQVEWLWKGYQERTSRGPLVVLPEGVFRPVASLARDTVVNLTSSALTPFPPQGPIGAFAAARYIRDGAASFLRSLVSPPRVADPSVATGRQGPAAQRAPSTADVAVVRIMYDPDTSDSSCDVDGLRVADIPSSVRTVLERVLAAAIVWRGKEVEKLLAAGNDAQEAFEDVTKRGVPPNSLTVKAEGDTARTFAEWWEDSGRGGIPLPAARQRGKIGHKLVAWRVDFPPGG
jgi:hypothetical protein